jgi:hypothetical protein
MLCDGCDEVFCDEPVTCGDCAFCCEECFLHWFGGAQARRPDVQSDTRQFPPTGARQALAIVAATVLGGVVLAFPGPAAAALRDASGLEHPAYAAATCHKRRVVGGERRRVTVPCGRRLVDPRLMPQRA